MVILFLLLGVSAKHFIDEDSTTVSQNETTGSATYSLWIAYKTKKVHQQRYISFTLDVQQNISYNLKRDISTELRVHWKAIMELWKEIILIQVICVQASRDKNSMEKAAKVVSLPLYFWAVWFKF